MDDCAALVFKDEFIEEVICEAAIVDTEDNDDRYNDA